MLLFVANSEYAALIKQKFCFWRLRQTRQSHTHNLEMNEKHRNVILSRTRSESGSEVTVAVNRVDVPDVLHVSD